MRASRVALAAVAATAVVHLFLVTRRLGSDEGGFAMVARQWEGAGGYLYGGQWVDRPPVLLAVFDLADHLGPYGVRLVATVLAVGLVGAAAVAAGTVGGPIAAAWSSWTAFALSSSVLLEAEQLNGELVAATFVAVSFAGLLTSLRPGTGPPGVVLSAGLAGAAAASAVLTKQNFVDGLVFAAVLLGVGLARPAASVARSRTRVVLAAGGFAAGTAVVVTAALLWAHGHGGVESLLYAMYGFRGDADTVLAGSSWSAPLHRLGLLAVAAIVSGLAVLAAHLVHTHRRVRSPLALALAAAAVVEVAGILAGGSFWLHYLLALVPTVAVGAGLAARHGQPAVRRTRGLVVYAVAVTAVAAPVGAALGAGAPSVPFATGRWLADSSRPGDTVVVPYTHANVIEASGLTPVYPYSWSLPARTLDPRLDDLVATLERRTRPTWVVVWDDLHSWGLDPDHRMERALRAHYRPTADVCGHPVWLRADVERDLAPPPPTEAC